MSDHDHAHDEDAFDVHPHVSSTKSNVVILLILFALTGLTLAAYNVRLGDANLFVAILIASIKATFVGAFFMHLKYEKAFNTMFFVGSVLFMGVFFAYTYNDLGYRGRIDGRAGLQYDPHIGFANGTAPGIVNERGEFAPLPQAEGDAETAQTPNPTSTTAPDQPPPPVAPPVEGTAPAEPAEGGPVEPAATPTPAPAVVVPDAAAAPAAPNPSAAQPAPAPAPNPEPATNPSPSAP